MTTLQAFLLGVMCAYTPSLFILAWILWYDFTEHIEAGGSAR